MPKPVVDYASYYVTDSGMTPEGCSFLDHLDQACAGAATLLKQGGVSVVQLREKNASTRDFLKLAQAAKEICDRHAIPLLINDRLDIALVVGCGLHVGQKDLPAKIARNVLGPDAIIGVSVSTDNELQEVLAAPGGQIDYIGIGPVHATQTKKDHNAVLGVRGIRDILAQLGTSEIKAVAIGGLNPTTVPNLSRQSTAFIVETGEYRCLDGIAYVSCVAASSEPLKAAQSITQMARALPTVYRPPKRSASQDITTTIQRAADILKDIRNTDPRIVQHVTNQVVMNDCANLALAFAQSPIMSGNPEEADDLGKAIGSLVLNMGTLNERQIQGATLCGQAANRNDKPIILDPVGVGATKYRKETISDLMDTAHVSIIKGNAGEIGAISGLTEVASRGVDSAGSGFKDPAKVVSELARREKVVVVMSGVIDYVSDGISTYAIANGHSLQGDITGSGCMAGTAIACFAAAVGHTESLQAALSGLLAYNIAAEIAAAQPGVQGPNTFRSALIDACYNLKPEHILQRAKLRLA